jgi:hypothetical protein
MAQMDHGYPTEVKTTAIIKKKNLHYEYTFYSKFVAMYISDLVILYKLPEGLN